MMIFYGVECDVDEIYVVMFVWMVINIFWDYVVGDGLWMGVIKVVIVLLAVDEDVLKVIELYFEVLR